MSTLTRAKAELRDARRVRRYIVNKLRTTEDDRHWLRRLEEQDERIRELTEREVMYDARRCHE